MPDLEPITRDEKLWSGEDLEPKTRREMYIKHLYDETQVIPDKPITREEIFILKAGEELHDVTIEQLNVTENGTYSEAGKAYSPVIVNVPQTTLTTLDVTENGTYTAPSGTAYNEVEVDVPLPENAYLLKEVEDLPKDIATFSDGSNLPMPNLKVSIEPIQSGSGDPSPTNVRPISGHTEANVSVSGVNVWDEEWEVGSIADSNGQNATNSNYRRSKNYISVKANKKYYFNVPNKYGTTYRFYQYKQNKDYIGVKTVDSDGTFETDNDCAFIRFRIATTEEYTNDISINYPSTDTEYHAYNGHTYTIPFTDAQGNPITVYGGTLDVVSGVLTVDRVLNTIDQNSTIQFRSTGRALTFITDAYKTVTMGGVNIICDKLKSAYYSNYDSVQNGEIATVSGSTAQTGISFKISDSITSLDELKAWLTSNPLTTVTNLATPLTIQLTPTQVSSLLGVNNVWADCGDIIDGQYFGKEV